MTDPAPGTAPTIVADLRRYAANPDGFTELQRVALVLAAAHAITIRDELLADLDAAHLPAELLAHWRGEARRLRAEVERLRGLLAPDEVKALTGVELLDVRIVAHPVNEHARIIKVTPSPSPGTPP